MTMSADERRALIEYRLEKSKTTFDNCEKLFDMEMYSFCANRLYYSLFYASSALLISEGIEAHTHQGIISMMGKYFIKTNKLSPAVGKTLKEVFVIRQEADYDDFIDVDKETIERILPQVKDALNAITNLVKL